MFIEIGKNKTRPAMKEIEQELAHKIDIRGVGTTGSGRELIGILIGSDTINDEITAHKTGALGYGWRMDRHASLLYVTGRKSVKSGC